jgi:hypothetical protein
MINFGPRVFVPIVLFFNMTAPGLPLVATLALASTQGEMCRKAVCDSAVEACMRSDLSLLPIVRTEARRKDYCSEIFRGCMTRTIFANKPWYSIDTVTRFLECAP